MRRSITLTDVLQQVFSMATVERIGEEPFDFVDLILISLVIRLTYLSCTLYQRV